jgi:heterotetrameric sarcosine oxidase gamma subunit
MFERSTFWSAPPAWSSARIDAPGLCVSACCVPAQLVSGAVEAWLAVRGESAFGPRHSCVSDSYALRLAPDTVLRVGEPAAAPGWHAADRIAVSAAGDAWILIDIEGASAAALLAQGCEYPFDTAPGPATESARMLFAGLVVAVSRRATGWRLHVDRAWAPALWRWLEVHADSSPT